MSEDFDKEAERKRLREKYENDKEDRESTERMSELLLQGATMTNRHCDTCGSPIFRYQGQEFCPKCQMSKKTGEEGNSAVQGGAAAQGAAASNEPTGDATTDTPPAQSTGQQPAETDASVGARETQSTPERAVTPGESESIEEIRRSLTQTLAKFAQQAAATDDPHRAREYLKTAQTAATTLRELPR